MSLFSAESPAVTGFRRFSGLVHPGTKLSLPHSLLAEEVTRATFNRVTLHAANFSKEIFVPTFPYILKATYICLLDIPPDTPVSSLKLTLQLEGLEAAKSKEFVDAVPAGADGRFVCMEWSAVDFLIQNEGTLKLTAYCNDWIHIQKWKVCKGDGAVRKLSSTVPPSKSVDGRKHWNPLNGLRNEVMSKILISDPYLTPEFLRRFLDSTTTHWDVRVITSERNFNKHISPNDVDLRISHPNLKIRFDELFHDRVIYRDEEEVVVFGASLKDLSNNRISFYQRIFDAEQSEETITLLEESWNRGKPR
ncbi:MAG: hypothetical protein WA071_10020 [Undibacterium umbellatum]|uniref:hypothetical protein n=1 Tax=Undibacterium umbellatum TaxID=2762300 RepID=UPI003BB633B0